MSNAPARKQAARPKVNATWRVVAYFVLLAIVNTIAFRIESVAAPYMPAWVATLLDAAFYLGGVLLLTWGFCRFLDRSSLSQLGLRKQHWLGYLGAGLGLGAALVFAAFAVLRLAGLVTVEVSAGWLSAEWVASAVLWIVISFVEELGFRGYILQGLARGWGMPIAVVVSSVLFGAVHATNPNASALGVLTICVGGLLFASAYLVTRSLWLPIGLHIGWNLVETQVLGFAGSGHVQPSILHTTVQGPVILTGGAFGPEGGLVTLAAEVVGLAVLLIVYRMARAREQTKG